MIYKNYDNQYQSFGSINKEKLPVNSMF